MVGGTWAATAVLQCCVGSGRGACTTSLYITQHKNALELIDEGQMNVVYRSLLSFGTQTVHGLYRSAIHCCTLRSFTTFVNPVSYFN